MIHQVAADGVVDTGFKSDLQLRADAVRRSDQYRLTQSWECAVKHASEAANVGQRARIKSPTREFLDLFSGTIRRVDIDAGIGIGCRFRHEFRVQTLVC